MEGNSANAPEPAPQKPPSKPKEQEKEKAKDQETFEIQAGPVKIKGRQNFVLALVLGVLGGVVLFYLVLFQLKRPQAVYRLLVEEPFYQTLTAAPTATPLPPRTVEVTREVTRIVPTVFVTRETVVVTREVVRRETVIATQIVSVPETVVVRPSPTPIPGASEILERDLQFAFDCGATALIQLGDNNIQDWSEDQIEALILAVWEPKCEALWIGFARERMIGVLVQMLKHFTEVDTVVWNAGVPQELQPSGITDVYDVIGFRTELQISGEYLCPNDPGQEVSILGDETPLVFESSRMKVEVQQNFDRIVILEWVPVDDARELLNNNCP